MIHFKDCYMIIGSGSDKEKISVGDISVRYSDMRNQILYEDIDFLKRFIEKRGFKAKLESDKR